MVEEHPKKRFKMFRVFWLTLSTISIVLLAIFFINITFKPPVTCPSDYCLHWVYGSCIGGGNRYKERTCFDYPDNSTTAFGCEQERKLYYEKSSEINETCK